ncbi:hypothetical protein LTS18_003370 [Coniosporium uncinatum]|uniref:Uncharacterized protein n=1 Tax=Coniosporium uncinatum TaxID=93489 RepID=A0ACC3DTR6_9PEZI|nr:hypothetical protein LTS18_003370 [Coniosporium uncinatum]
MSNIIPEIREPNEFPYCFWHPVVASEETYRKLAKRYPQLRYLVGRACAVAGYTDLYQELDLLPEVSIAEEARESDVLGAAIYRQIMSSKTKYAVLDDYTRTINEHSPRVAHLNGDTCVRSYLDAKQEHNKAPCRNPYNNWEDHYDKRYFDITEDMCVDLHRSELEWPPEVLDLLFTPLPADLPTARKDPLILSAAHYGDIDRYARLKRPEMVEYELECVVRGIYHNTMFAKWWSLQARRLKQSEAHAIGSAVEARFIMNNDLSRVKVWSEDFVPPEMIWYPTRAHWKTYEELARLSPKRGGLARAAAHACIVCDYQHSFDKIEFVPSAEMLGEARQSHNPYYLQKIERMAEEQQLDLDGDLAIMIERDDDLPTVRRLFEPSTTCIYNPIHMGSLDWEIPDIYGSVGPQFSAIELKVCAPRDVQAKHDNVGILDDYQSPDHIRK